MTEYPFNNDPGLREAQQISKDNITSYLFDPFNRPDMSYQDAIKELEQRSTINKQLKIYICGPMTGIENFNEEAFKQAESNWRVRGYEVINPWHEDNIIYEKAMGYRATLGKVIKDMLHCDCIALLKGWNISKGARQEVFLAYENEMEIFDAETGEKMNIYAQLNII